MAAKKLRRTNAKVSKEKASTPSRLNLDRVNAVVEETLQMRIPSKLAIRAPNPRLKWTQDLPDYQDALTSAVHAMHRILCATQAIQAGHGSAHPSLEVFLFQIRAGLVDPSDPCCSAIVLNALQAGRKDIYEEIAAAKLAAVKRGKVCYADIELSGTGWSDLNWFRMLLAIHWVCFGFWLMPDDLIARLVTTLKLRPLGCNRQTINKAVKEMELYQRKPPLYMDIGKGGILVRSPDFESLILE